MKNETEQGAPGAELPCSHWQGAGPDVPSPQCGLEQAGPWQLCCAWGHQEQHLGHCVAAWGAPAAPQERAVTHRGSEEFLGEGYY